MYASSDERSSWESDDCVPASLSDGCAPPAGVACLWIYLSSGVIAMSGRTFSRWSSYLSSRSSVIVMVTAAIVATAPMMLPA